MFEFAIAWPQGCLSVHDKRAVLPKEEAHLDARPTSQAVNIRSDRGLRFCDSRLCSEFSRRVPSPGRETLRGTERAARNEDTCMSGVRRGGGIAKSNKDGSRDIIGLSYRRIWHNHNRYMPRAKANSLLQRISRAFRCPPVACHMLCLLVDPLHSPRPNVDGDACVILFEKRHFVILLELERRELSCVVWQALAVKKTAWAC